MGRVWFECGLSAIELECSQSDLVKALFFEGGHLTPLSCDLMKYVNMSMWRGCQVFPSSHEPPRMQTQSCAHRNCTDTARWRARRLWHDAEPRYNGVQQLQQRIWRGDPRWTRSLYREYVWVCLHGPDFYQKLGMTMLFQSKFPSISQRRSIHSAPFFPHHNVMWGSNFCPHPLARSPLASPRLYPAAVAV